MMMILFDCVRKLPYTIDRPIDFEKAIKLYDKTRPGYVDFISFGNKNIGYPVIIKKRMQSWVERNWTKLLRNKKEWLKEIRRSREVITDNYEKQFYKQFDEVMMGDFEKDFKKDYIMEDGDDKLEFVSKSLL